MVVEAHEPEVRALLTRRVTLPHHSRAAAVSPSTATILAPAGVFVVDAKHYEGRIEIRNKGWFLRPDYRLYVGHRDCSRLAESPTWQVDAVATALRGAEVDPLPPLTPVLCFIDGDWPLISPPNSFAGVRLESPKSLRRIAAAGSRLDVAEIDRLARIIGSALPAK